MKKKILSNIIIVALLLTVITPSQLVYTYAFANDNTNEENQIVQEEEELESVDEATTAILPEVNSEAATTEVAEVETEIFVPTENDFSKDIFKAIQIDIIPFASNGVDSNDALRDEIANVTSGGTIEITADFELAQRLTIPAGKKITISSAAGGKYIISQKTLARHFEVEGELTLENIILEGDNVAPVQRYGGISVNSYGILNIKAGTVIQKCNGIYGGAIQVAGNGHLNLIDGEIKNNLADNYGGGVHLEENATFIMSGGSIHGNICRGNGNGGGAVHINGGSFTMTAGKLKDNVANDYGGGVYIDGNGSFTMDGTAEISGNKAKNGAGVILYDSQNPIMANGAGTFTMKGGSIYDNEALAGGGGVLVAAGNGVFSLEGGVIRKNLAPNGGGIYILAGKVDVADGSVNDNVAGINGGGIYGHTDTTLSITGGEILRNKAISGAGIYDIGTITIANGDIGGNVATETAGGVYAREVTVTDSYIWANRAKYGAGMYIKNYYADSTAQQQFTSTISNSLIRYNYAGEEGGGIAVLAGTLVLEDDTRIFGNMAFDTGGGLHMGSVSHPNLTATARLEMKDSTITQNGIFDTRDVTKQGGGIYFRGGGGSATPDAVIENSLISQNFAECGGGILSYKGNILMTHSNVTNNLGIEDGGGIYLFEDALLDIGSTSSINNNKAPNGKGGGIFNAKSTYKNVITDYDNLTIAANTKFTGNTAKAQFDPPTNALALYANIGFDGVSAKSHPLNDYDINYYSESTGGSGGGGGTTEESTSEGTTQIPGGTTEENTETVAPSSEYTVTYHANGGKGKAKKYTAEFGESHFVLSIEDTGHTFDGYRFIEWNTKPNGGGEAYKIDDVIVVTEHVTLYAQWSNQNGHSGGSTTTETETEKSTTARPETSKPGAPRPVGSPSTGVQDTVRQHFLGLGISFLLMISLIWTNKKRAE